MILSISKFFHTMLTYSASAVAISPIQYHLVRPKPLSCCFPRERLPVLLSPLNTGDVKQCPIAAYSNLF
jgi:hypothetical protein